MVPLAMEKALCAILVVAVVAVRQSMALKCYSCSNIKTRQVDTCGDPKLWKEVEGTAYGSRCRVLKLGGQIVAMGSATEKLCSNNSLSTTKMKMVPRYVGKGKREAYCCKTDFCMDDESASSAGIKNQKIAQSTGNRPAKPQSPSQGEGIQYRPNFVPNDEVEIIQNVGASAASNIEANYLSHQEVEKDDNKLSQLNEEERSQALTNPAEGLGGERSGAGGMNNIGFGIVIAAAALSLLR